jgi:hypothetical protein
MTAVGVNGSVSFTQGLFVLNLVFIGLLYRQKRWLLWPYMPTSWLFLFGYPQNMPILFLEALGFWNPLFVVLALIVKLPVGAPLSVWQFAFTSPTSLRDPSNWIVYSTLIAWGVAAFTWKRFGRRIVKRGLAAFRPRVVRLQRND